MLPDVHHFKPTARPRKPGGYSWEDKYSRASIAQPHEPLERYVQGGFHPVALGDTFHNGRYTIRYKLGYGGFSTVWLARDTHRKYENFFSQGPRMSSYSDSNRLIHGRQWVSLKIKQASASTSSLDEDPDIKAFMALEHKHVSSTPSSPKYFAQLLETFQHQGPNGTHTCLVVELLGPAVSSVMMVYNNFEIKETLRPDTILRASKQLLESIHAMHESGIVHGGI
jgi:serine/threonine protein kinase